jgi:hypothetical protein
MNITLENFAKSQKTVAPKGSHRKRTANAPKGSHRKRAANFRDNARLNAAKLKCVRSYIKEIRACANLSDEGLLLKPSTQFNRIADDLATILNKDHE